MVKSSLFIPKLFSCYPRRVASLGKQIDLLKKKIRSLTKHQDCLWCLPLVGHRPVFTGSLPVSLSPIVFDPSPRSRLTAT